MPFFCLGVVRDGVRRGDRHLVGDLARPYHQGALEDAGEADGVVHLVGEVAPPGGHHVGPGFLGGVGIDLGHRVGAGEDDGLRSHAPDPLLLDGVRARLRSRDDDVGALEGLFLGVDATRVGRLADLPLAVEGGVGFHVVPALVQAALAVEHDHLLRVAAGHQDEAGRGAVGRSGAQEDDLGILELLAHHPQGVDEAGQGHARRPLGVVVPHRDVALLAEGVEHLEAVGLGDVLEVDGAEAGLQHLDEVDDLVGVVLALFVVAVDAQGHRRRRRRGTS